MSTAGERGLEGERAEDAAAEKPGRARRGRFARKGTCFAIGCAARRRRDYWKCNFVYATEMEEAELRVHADVFNAWPSYRPRARRDDTPGAARRRA